MKTFAITILLLTISPQIGLAQSPDSWLEKNIKSLAKLYLHFHQNPELSYFEKKTGQKLGKELAAVGATVTQNVGGFGVVGILENGEGPVVMVRTDLDALPVTEETNLPYASKVKVKNENGIEVGVMHACGHDIHMTTLVGTAQYLASCKQDWSGTVVFIGQPAEERGAGALAMLNDGLFEKFPKPDYALALHCNSTFASGKVSLRPGYAMANVDSVDVTLYGRGGHGAYPHTTIDPIVEAAKFIVDLQTLVSREVKPIEAGVVTVGSIQAGTKHNIIPDSCHLQLTVRSYSDEVRKLLLDGIQRKAKAAAMSVGADEPLIKVSEGTPSLSNDAELASRMKQVFINAVGNDNVFEQEPVMGGEDFSQYGRAGVPSLMYFLGVVEQARLDRYKEMNITPPSLHSANFYPDIEKSLETGVKTMASAVLDLMKRN
ncbi:MAG: amidohydrolase [Planctomycetota bacterium]